MSKISIIYDKLREIIPTILVGRTELPNPYSLINNPSIFLKKGWGLAVSEGVKSEIETYCHDFETRTFTIVITDHLASLNNSHEAMAVKTKDILEEIRSVKNRFLAFDQITIDDSIEKIEFESCSGLEFLASNDVSYLVASITIAIDFSEII